MEKDNTVIGLIKTLDTLIGRKAFELIKKIDGDKLCPGHLQFEILKYLFLHKDEEIIQKDLEMNLGISKAAISGALESMKRQGTIIKKQSKKDKRVNNIKISENSEIVFKKLKTMHNEVSSLLVKDITKEELEVFNIIIGKMINNIGGR